MISLFHNLTLWKKNDIVGMEKALKDHLYFSMKRMRYQIDVEYRDYFEEEETEDKFDIWWINTRFGLWSAVEIVCFLLDDLMMVPGEVR